MSIHFNLSQQNSKKDKAVNHINALLALSQLQVRFNGGHIECGIFRVDQNIRFKRGKTLVRKR